MITIYRNNNLFDKYTLCIKREDGSIDSISLLFKVEREPNYPKGDEVPFEELPSYVKADILRYLTKISE